jgi:hypothetical protein
LQNAVDLSLLPRIATARGVFDAPEHLSERKWLSQEIMRKRRERSLETDERARRTKLALEEKQGNIRKDEQVEWKRFLYESIQHIESEKGGERRRSLSEVLNVPRSLRPPAAQRDILASSPRDPRVTAMPPRDPRATARSPRDPRATAMTPVRDPRATTQEASRESKTPSTCASSPSVADKSDNESLSSSGKSNKSRITHFVTTLEAVKMDTVKQEVKDKEAVAQIMLNDLRINRNKELKELFLMVKKPRGLPSRKSNRCTLVANRLLGSVVSDYNAEES